MGISRTGKIIAGAAAILIAAAVVSMTSAFRRSTAREQVLDGPEGLNAVLTNEKSDVPALHGLDSQIENYMRTWGLNGVSLSVMRNDSLLYAKGYGNADIGKPMSPGNIMRMASVSKLITAAGIMVLKDRDSLSLSDKVFGPGGILDDPIFNAAIKDQNYYKITVEDLLRHKGGFSRRGGDPLFATRWLMIQNHWTSVPSEEQLLLTQLKRPLRFEPGTWQYYSNFGYLVLSMVIEKISKMDYDSFIQENVLRPAGCLDFKIAGNYYKDRYPEEVRYYVQKDDEPAEEFNNSGRKVVRCYGGNNVTGLAGAGAWVASTPELALFVASIDGKPEVPDIISKTSVKTMTEYFDNSTYSIGWIDTKPDGELTRSGTFSGTSALIKYYPDGECWIFITNTSTYKGPALADYTAGLFRRLRAAYSSKLPKRNLFLDKRAGQTLPVDEHHGLSD